HLAGAAFTEVLASGGIVQRNAISPEEALGGHGTAGAAAQGLGENLHSPLGSLQWKNRQSVPPEQPLVEEEERERGQGEKHAAAVEAAKPGILARARHRLAPVERCGQHLEPAIDTVENGQAVSRFHASSFRQKTASAERA